MKNQFSLAILLALLFSMQYTAAQNVTVPFRINCGIEGATTYNGNTFELDAHYLDGGTSTYTGNSLPALYQSERYGSLNGYKELNYSFPIANGTYDITLHFAEVVYTSAGARVFDIDLEGTTVLTNYDIYAEVGGAATTKTFEVTVADGSLDIYMNSLNHNGGSGPHADAPKVSAIEILDSSSTPPPSGSTLWSQSSSNSDIYFDSGNVGIGTTTPTGKLEILKDADLTSAITLPNSGLLIRADNDGNDASLRFGVDNSNLKAVVQTQQTTTATKFDLLLNPFGGNVGIGTTNTYSYKLAVNGTIRAKEIRVEVDNWPDYVFAKDYNLPTLEEVAQHIKEKGHLINIPSAAELEDNGIQLGEMNKLLLEKIEELTLYLLQQQEEIQSLRDQIENR